MTDDELRAAAEYHRAEAARYSNEGAKVWRLRLRLDGGTDGDKQRLAELQAYRAAAASPAAPQEDAPLRREIRSSRHPHFTHEDHQRMQEALDSLSGCPTEEEAESVLQACGTSGKEVVNEFIERLLRENVALKVKLEPAAPTPSQPARDAARNAAEEGQKWRVALRMFEKSQDALHELRQQVEDTILVAQTDEDSEGGITAYHFKTGAIHRLLAKAREGDGPAESGDNAALRHAISAHRAESISAAATEIANRYFGDYPEKAQPKIAAIISRHLPAAAETVGENSADVSDYDRSDADIEPLEHSSLGHVDYVFDNMPCCKVCGLVRPAIGWTRNCKGRPELSLRRASDSTST